MYTIPWPNIKMNRSFSDLISIKIGLIVNNLFSSLILLRLSDSIRLKKDYHKYSCHQSLYIKMVFV